jgi:hypothetical protein
MPIARELKGGPGGAYGGQLAFCKSVFDPAQASRLARLQTCGRKNMKRLGLGIIVAIGFTLPALADPPQLKGDYAFTYADFCLQSTSGFNTQNFTPLAGPVDAGSSGVTGFQHFNGDGTGTATTAGGVGINFASTPLGSSVTNSPFSFKFTYTKPASDGSFTETIVPGSLVGPGFSINPGGSALGFVSNDGKTFVATAATPSIQTVTIDGSPPIKIYRVCRTNTVGIKLNPAD